MNSPERARIPYRQNRPIHPVNKIRPQNDFESADAVKGDRPPGVGVNPGIGLPYGENLEKQKSSPVTLVHLKSLDRCLVQSKIQTVDHMLGEPHSAMMASQPAWRPPIVSSTFFG